MFGGFAIGCTVAGRVGHGQIERYGQPSTISQFGPHRFDGQPMRQIEMMHGLQRSQITGDARRVYTAAIAKERHAEGFVQRGPCVYFLPQRMRHDRSVFGEPLRHVTVLPATAVLRPLRQIPMIQRDYGLDVGVS